MKILKRALEEYPLQGSMEGNSDGKLRTNPVPIRSHPGGPIIGWLTL